jgi:hypothetical protein
VVQTENVFNDSLHWLNTVTALFVNFLMLRLVHVCDHLLTLFAFVRVLPTVRNQINFALSAKLTIQVIIGGLWVHSNIVDDPLVGSDYKP